jgi:hypothetical protein
MPVVFWTVFFAGIIAVVGVIIFAWHNPSQGLVLSVAAFVGAFALLCVHSLLELKNESTSDRAVAEYTLDRHLPELASAFYATDLPGSLRGSIEKEISALVARQNPNAFKKEPEELAQDMAITSFLAMLFLYQPDWQLRPLKSSARYTFSMESFEPLSQPEDCTKVSVENINSNLQIAENVFAEIPSKPIYIHEICLPPNAKVRIERRAVVIETDYCDITVAVKKTGSQTSTRPRLIRPDGSRSITPEDPSEGPANLLMGVPDLRACRFP